jgi:SAM-dependent methyltransferase
MAYDDAYERSIAKNYDAEYAVIRDPSGDRAFYADLARETGGPVLELACGTGRVLLPIARTGIPCVGLDLSPAMLDVFRAKDLPPNLELVQASMTDYDLGAGRFRLIYAAFRPFQHLLAIDDQLAALACARRHLAPGGLLAFDMFFPDMARLAGTEEPEAEDVRAQDGDEEVRRYATIRRDHVAQVLHVRFRHERWRDGVKLSDETTELQMRWFWRFELEHLLARAGFEVKAMYGGFDRRPFAAKGEMIVVAGVRS